MGWFSRPRRCVSGRLRAGAAQRVAGASRVESLEERRLLAGQLVADINQTSSTETSIPDYLVVSGGKAFFWDGTELWVTDGSPAGTRKLPAHGFYPWEWGSPVDANGTLFFTGGTFDAAGGELWKSDGTAAGTRMVKDINPGPVTSDLRFLTNVGGSVYFAAHTSQAHWDFELWKSDGTEGGTYQVKDIRPGTPASDPRSLTAVGNTLFFVADDGVHGYELWKSDGTAAGTVMVRDILPGAGTSGAASLVNLNGTLFFTADDGFGGLELWRSDGTEAGTFRVKDVQPGQGGSAPAQLTVVNATLYFIADNGTHGYELWKSDGTEAGTALVRDIIAGATGTGLTHLTASGGRLYFTANDGVNGLELWKSDGTAAGTVMVRDVRPGTYWVHAAPSRLTDVNGTLYFSATTYENGKEFWRTDGTAAGTVMVRDLMPGAFGSQPWSHATAAALGNALLFAGYDGQTFKLFRSDRLTGVTQPLAEIKRTNVPQGSKPSSPVYFNGTTLFCADDGVSGAELWKTDGTAAGTVLVKDITPGPGGSAPSMMTVAGGRLFFVAANGLWTTDGTAAGTQRAGPFVNQSHEPQLVAAGSRVFYRSADGNGEELWASDGTPGGAYRVRDIAPGPRSSRIFDMTAVGNLVYFVANDGVSGDELWRSDGTAAGTFRVRDLVPGPASSGPWDLEAVGGTLFFRATDGTSGYELFKTDGTAAGTVLVKDILPGPGNSLIGNLRSVNGALLFTADGDANGIELWRSDGTAEGTFELKDIYGGPRTSGIYQAVVAGNVMYFRAADGNSGYELWRSDGTWEGTYQVADIRPGPGGSNPTSLVLSGGTLFFTANDGTGYRLWQSDGRYAGTLAVPGANASVNPWTVVKSGNTLFFSADDGTHGHELWKADFTPLRLSVAQAAVKGSLAPAELVTSNQPQALIQAPGVPTAPVNTPLPETRLPTRQLAEAPQPSPAPASLGAVQPAIYDGTLFHFRPQLASFGMPVVTVGYNGYTPDGDWGIMDEAGVRALARHAASFNSPLIFDVEHWPADVRIFSDGEVQQRMEHLALMVDWAHDERPGLKVGFYGLMPLTDYWSPVGGGGLLDWQAANRRLQPLADRVDLVLPSLYTYYEERNGWQSFAQANLAEAAKYGKPIVPFLWMNYHESEPDVGYRPIAADYWQMQLRTVRPYASQIIIWGPQGEAWDDGAAWWAVTREFLAPRRLAAEIANVTPHPRAAAVNEVTVRFTRPVTGFDLSDLSLSRPGGPNLLAGAAGVSLTSPDGVTWTLAGLGALTAADGTYTVNLTGYATIRDAGGETLAVGASEVFRVDTTLPVTALGAFDPQSGRQIRFTFNRDVSATLDPSDLVLVNRTTNQAVPTVSAVLAYDPLAHVATFTLPERLANADYRAVLRSTSVADAGGVSMASDYLFDFYMLTGDINRDRAVNGADFAILAANFGRTGMTYAQGDLNGDAAVNGGDFALLSGNFGRTLPAPLSFEAAAVQLAPAPAPHPAVTTTKAPPPPRRQLGKPAPALKKPAPLKRHAPAPPPRDTRLERR